MRKTLFFLLLTLPFLGFTQMKAKREKIPSYFGIQVRPIIPINFFGTGPLSTNGAGLQATTTQQFGFSFGATIRAGLTKLLALETGINITKRNFRNTYAFPDSSLTGSSSLGIVSYDIPLNLLVYVKISETFYMNVSMGGSANFYPTNVESSDNHYPYAFQTIGIRKNWLTVALNANVGFEYRTQKSGFFYLGGSLQYPFSPIYTIINAYTYKDNQFASGGLLGGAIITVDLKYFFPNIKLKGKQYLKGPIE